MNCNHVQNLLSAFIDDELNPLEKRELRRHLFFCPECHTEYQYFLKLKDQLNNLKQEPFNYDPLVGFRIRVAEAEHSFFPEVNRLFMLGRLGLIAGCMTLFFISTIALFPNDSRQTKIVQYAAPEPNLAPAPVSLTASQEVSTPVDQNFSLDEPVTVYQASTISP